MAAFFLRGSGDGFRGECFAVGSWEVVLGCCAACLVHCHEGGEFGKDERDEAIFEWMMQGRGFEVEHRDWDDGVGFMGVMSANGEFGGGVGLQVVEGLSGRGAEDPRFLRGFCGGCPGFLSMIEF